MQRFRLIVVPNNQVIRSDQPFVALSYLMPRLSWSNDQTVFDAYIWRTSRSANL